MAEEREVRMAERSTRSDGGGGYRFNLYGQGQGKKKGEEESKKKPKEPVSVQLSEEAEKILAEQHEEGQDQSTDTSTEQSPVKEAKGTKKSDRLSYLNLGKKSRA